MQGDWDATVSVGDYSALQHMLIVREPAPGPELAVVEVFDVLPVAVLRGQKSRR
jgi:hypothetical protein